jgi:hypothetical protein
VGDNRDDRATEDGNARPEQNASDRTIKADIDGRSHASYADCGAGDPPRIDCNVTVKKRHAPILPGIRLQRKSLDLGN